VVIQVTWQIKERRKIMTDEEREQLTGELTNWIDARVIAHLIIETLEDAELEVNLTNAKDLWYDELGMLSTHLRERRE